MHKYLRATAIVILLALLLIAGGSGWIGHNPQGIASTKLVARLQALFRSDSAASTAANNADLKTAEPDSQSLPDGASEEWLAKVQQDIALKQYAARSIPADELPAGVDATHWAPNPTHNLRTYFTASGIAVRPFQVDETTATAARATLRAAQRWSFGMSLGGVGTRGALADADTAVQNIDGNRVEYQRGNVTEWYVNDGNGLEQGFTVNAPPADVTDELVLTLNTDGNLSARVISAGMVALDDGDGDAELYLRNLLVKDANDAVLPAQFASVNGKLAIAVDVRDASYPIVVDPVLSNVPAFLERNQAGAAFGRSVAAAGDVNGDGYADLLVGASGYDNGQSNEGAAFLYLGSASGPANVPAWQAEVNQSGANFGWSVAGAGDVNGDGFGDVIVGAPFYTNGQTDEGAVFVYLGSASGLSTSAAVQLERNQANAALGNSVAAAGDINNDGYADILAGANLYDNGQTDEGAVFVYLGSASGLNPVAAAQLESNQAAASFGQSVATAGDVNGDGYSDVVVGANQFDNGEAEEGAALVYLGSAAGLNTTVATQLESNQTNAYFGYSVATAGDVNGDGYGDVIVGAYGYNNGQNLEGAAFVYLGSAGGLGSVAAWQVESNQFDARLGTTVAAAGDVNSDGYGDVIVGAVQYDNDQANEGAVFVYVGSGSGLASTPAWQAEGNQAGGFGNSVAAAGDINNDGYGDVLVGAYGYSNGQTTEGVTFVYLASADGLTSVPTWQGERNQGGADLGYSVAGAGDVNGDGYGDVIVGAPEYDNVQTYEGAAFVYPGSASGLSTVPAWQVESNLAGARFGFSVASAGDVNGDGFGDVIVGARQYSNVENAEGATFVYLGSASGLAATPAWQAEANQAVADFGYSVSGAGDVNGDGYSDVIVGAYSYDNGTSNEGAVFVYPGSASGLAVTPGWQIEGNQLSAFFGVSVASAGDVNGDGYGDVIVGALFYENGNSKEGAAFVYPGSANGLLTAPIWQAEGNQDNAQFGRSVAAAGDVNGDGYGDVLVGVTSYNLSGSISTTPGEGSQKGAAFMYLGSASGLSATPAWQAEADQAGASFGYSVSSAGDVNGDGYGDVIVGAYNYDNGQFAEGAAFIYLGSMTGLSGVPVWQAESNQVDALFGYSVAGAGDVNGDGIGDVLVGAHDYGNGQAGEGVVFSYSQANSAFNAQPVQRNTASILLPSQARVVGSFKSGLAGYATVERGNQAKLSVENCALPATFGGAECATTESVSWQTVASGGTPLTLDINPASAAVYAGTSTAFVADGLHRWRGQLSYNVNAAKAAPWTPRRSPWRYYQGDLAKSVVDIVIDADNDSIRDRLDSDDDNDTVLDTLDVFPQNNAEGYDNDSDGTGDNGDTDDDGDGTPDSTDTNAGTPSLLLSNLGAAVTATAGTAFNLDINAGFDGPGRNTAWYSGTPYFVLQKSDGAGGWITLTVNGSGFIQDAQLGWLTFDPATGELAGFPQSGNTGVYNLRLVVTNGSGGSGYAIDVNGDGSSLLNEYAFTFTVPENQPPTITIAPLDTDGYVTNEPVISGTASDPESALDRIDLQIEGDNGTAYIGGDLVAGAPAWTTICSGSSCTNWQLNTTTENYVDEVYYTVRARARDAAGNFTQDETGFSFYGGNQVYTTLQLIASSTSILFEDTMQLNVKLSVPGDAGANLAGLPVVISVDRPAGSTLPPVDDIIRSTDSNGRFTTPLLLGSAGSDFQFDEPGDWTLSARFNVDAPILPQYQSSSATSIPLRVGSSAGYALLVQGKISTGEGQLEHNKTLNRIYRTMTGRNLRDQDIYYYNHNVSQDANEDGFPDNNEFFNPYQGVDGLPDKATVQATIENLGILARSNPGPVWIVLHDHGNRVSNASVFQLTPSSTITAAELDAWITTLEYNLYTGTGITPATAPVIVVNAYCYSGGFLQALSKPGRIVISSADEAEASYKGPLEEDGLRSGEVFAEALFEELGYDRDIYAAFTEATVKTEAYTRSEDGLNPNTDYPYFDASVQHPLLDDNGDGIGSNDLSAAIEGDGLAAQDVKLGTGLTVVTNSAESPAALLSVTPTKVLSPSASNLELIAQANFNSYVAAAFYEIRPPGTILPGGIAGSEQLEANSYKRYLLGSPGACAAPNNTVFCLNHGGPLTAPDNFSQPGKYEVFYYVKDSETGDLSPQLRSVVYKQLSGNLAPPAPALSFPANAASNVFRAALLEWTGVTDADLTGSPLTYTVRIATDAAMTNIVYTAEEIPFAFHQVPLEAGLAFSTTYYWDVEAIDGFGASVDRNASGIWSPSAPFTFTTEGSGNNVYGVVHGAIRGLTASNQIITSLTNASIAQTNNTALSERVSYDPTIQNSNGTTGAYAYTVWALPGTVNLQADADNFVAKSKTGITIQADQTITGQSFLLSAEVLPVTVRVNNDLALHANHNHAPANGLPDDVVPVNVYGSATISANLINPASLKVGPGLAPDRNNAAVLGNVNADAYQDATFDVWMSASQIACSATQVTVTGELTGGQPFSGTDTVTTDCNAVCH